MSSKACGGPEEQRWGLYADSFPRGFLEEAAAELNFEGLELTWGVRRERAGACGRPGAQASSGPARSGVSGLCPAPGAPARAQRSGQLPEGEKDRVPGPTSG